MATSAYVTSNTLGADLDAVYIPASATGDSLAYPNPPFAAGTRLVGTDNSEWCYVLASGAIAIYDWVGINDDGVASSLTVTTAATKPAIGVAQVAIGDTYYGWVCTKGGNGANVISGNVLLSCAKDVPLYATATAGYLDDAQFSSVATGLIQGVKAVVSVGTVNTSTQVMLTWPMTAPGSAT